MSEETQPEQKADEGKKDEPSTPTEPENKEKENTTAASGEEKKE